MFESRNNIIAVGNPDERTWQQIENCASVVEFARLMADCHAGYGCPIGGVMADENKIAPAVVGFDIACGIKAVRIYAETKEVIANIATIMDEVQRQISFGVGRKNNTRVESPVFDMPQWREIEFLRKDQALHANARNQLGTVGSGNHFVNIFVDEEGAIWVGCHFGSRGLGHKIATHFMEAIGSSDGMDDVPKTMDANSDLGQQYIEAMKLAGAYAYAGRDWVCDTVTNIIGGRINHTVHSHHNFLWQEEHFGRKLWVGRKGATPAFPGQQGMIASSMCEPCLIVEGVDSSDSKRLLYSTVHGAGRVMSRTQAAGKRSRKTGELILDPVTGQPKNPGVVSQEMMDEWVKNAGVELRGGGRDESPHVYKRLSEVIGYHGDTIKIVNRLRPIGVAMAGNDVVDPYKD